MMQFNATEDVVKASLMLHVRMKYGIPDLFRFGDFLFQGVNQRILSFPKETQFF